MSDEIKPALTPDEWMLAFSAGIQVAGRLHVRLEPDGVVMLDKEFGRDPVDWAAAFGTTETRCRLAALLLVNSGGGFTWEDVDLLHRASGLIHATREPFVLGDEEVDLDLLAERIAALLPPRA